VNSLASQRSRTRSSADADACAVPVALRRFGNYL